MDTYTGKRSTEMCGLQTHTHPLLHTAFILENTKTKQKLNNNNNILLRELFFKLKKFPFQRENKF